MIKKNYILFNILIVLLVFLIPSLYFYQDNKLLKHIISVEISENGNLKSATVVENLEDNFMYIYRIIGKTNNIINIKLVSSPDNGKVSFIVQDKDSNEVALSKIYYNEGETWTVNLSNINSKKYTITGKGTVKGIYKFYITWEKC